MEWWNLIIIGLACGLAGSFVGQRLGRFVWSLYVGRRRYLNQRQLDELNRRLRENYLRGFEFDVYGYQRRERLVDRLSGSDDVYKLLDGKQLRRWDDGGK